MGKAPLHAQFHFIFATNLQGQICDIICDALRIQRKLEIQKLQEGFCGVFSPKT